MRLLERLKNFTLVREGNNVYTGPNPNDSAGDGSTGFSAAARKALRNAYKNPTVCAVVEWITDQAATTPYMLTRLDSDGEAEAVTEHPLLDLLRKPSEYLSGRELLSVSIWDMLISGQCFWHKERNGSGLIDGLTYMQARQTKVLGNATELITGYEHKPTGANKVIYPPEDVVHIRIKPDPFDPKNGLSPLICLATALMIDESTGLYTASALTSQGAPGGLLMPKGEEILTEEVATATKKYIQGEFAAAMRGRIGVLRAAMDYVNTSLDASANTLREIKNMSQEEICGVLGVHPVILGLGAGASQSRVGAATVAFEVAAWSNRIIPLEDTISEQIGRQLLPDFEPDDTDNWDVDFDRSGVPVLQPDKLQEATRWVNLVKGGVSTRYEALVSLGQPAEDTDKVYLVANNIQAVPAGEAPPAPAAPEDTAPDDPEDEEPEERSAVQREIYKIARTKAELNDMQRALLLSLAEDIQEIEPEFSNELETAFVSLGQRAVDAFWVVEGGDSIRALGTEAETKQTEEEILAEVERIIRAMGFNQWSQTVMAPIFDAYYLRTLLTTIDSVSAALSLAVNIPDPVAREVVRQGGIRLGLIDLNRQTRDSLFQALFEGRSAGEGPAQLAQRIQGQIPRGPWRTAQIRARVIARTEVKWSQNISTLESYRQSETITHVIIVDAQGAGDNDPECSESDGQQLTIAQADQVPALVHPNCTRSFTPVVGDPTPPAAT